MHAEIYHNEGNRPMSIYASNIFEPHPAADEKYIVRGEKYRITVLTDCLLRLEYSEDGVFEDRATRLAFNRAFDTPEFECYHEADRLHIVTKHLHLRYDEKAFSAIGLEVVVNGTLDWQYGVRVDNLGGTVRTLDRVNGATDLNPGLLSRTFGISVVDDSDTIVIGEDGWPLPLCGTGRKDLYFFGYGREFERCIRDFYKLSAPVPLLPRYALGNWWSRYHKYTDVEYLALMDKFKAKRVPLSVGVVDMDWHITETPDREKYGSGWTGYTWNKTYFPDYKQFLREMQQRGLKVTLNLHPRDGIRAYEEIYPTLAKRLGRDPETGRKIEFDVADRRFMEEYFNTVLHPYEEAGVDFWWIDWQQRSGSSVAGYDTLWMLNHCHFVDNARDGHRPLTLSRYAGIGSHRYPLGFSGDTYVTWESLNFQPYFTATAANLGYAWWSHDIGGHMGGYHDSELHTRWVQFGVFSPISRLHSSPNPFNSKEPWNYGDEAEGIMEDYLRLRGRLVPYMYSMVYRNFEDGIPMVRPIYHAYPTTPGTFDCKNEYLFGTLIAAPVTTKCDPQTLLAKTTVWLPAGNYVDYFTGRIYTGGRLIDTYRPLSEMPLFAKTGTILPLTADVMADADTNPTALELYVAGGADGAFTLVEDNGKSGGSRITTRTAYSFTWGEDSTLAFTAAGGAGIPDARDYALRMAAVERPTRIYAEAGGEVRELTFDYDEVKHEATAVIGTVKAGDKVAVHVLSSGKLPENELKQTAFKLLADAQYDHGAKETLYGIFTSNRTLVNCILALQRRDEKLAAPLIELLTAKQ